MTARIDPARALILLLDLGNTGIAPHISLQPTALRSHCDTGLLLTLWDRARAGPESMSTPPPMGGYRGLFERDARSGPTSSPRHRNLCSVAIFGRGGEGERRKPSPELTSSSERGWRENAGSDHNRRVSLRPQLILVRLSPRTDGSSSIPATGAVLSIKGCEDCDVLVHISTTLRHRANEEFARSCMAISALRVGEKRTQNRSCFPM